jgi:hypothetical protein
MEQYSPRLTDVITPYRQVTLIGFVAVTGGAENPKRRQTRVRSLAEYPTDAVTVPCQEATAPDREVLPRSFELRFTD